MKRRAISKDWLVICQVCRETLYASESTKRWDGLIVGRDHKGCLEHKHPLDMPQRLLPDEKALPFTSPEGVDVEIEVNYSDSLESASMPTGTFELNNETL